MPTRLIREGLIDSERVNELSAEGERFFVHLMLQADDWGRFDGRATMLQKRLFPLRDDVTLQDVCQWANECAEKGLLAFYVVKDKPYIQLLRFNQRLRAKRSKYPDPGDGHMTDACPSSVSHTQATFDQVLEAKANNKNRKAPNGGPLNRSDDEEPLMVNGKAVLWSFYQLISKQFISEGRGEYEANLVFARAHFRGADDPIAWVRMGIKDDYAFKRCEAEDKTPTAVTDWIATNIYLENTGTVRSIWPNKNGPTKVGDLLP